jgi:hypothetical protein
MALMMMPTDASAPLFLHEVIIGEPAKVRQSNIAIQLNH